MFAYEKLTCSKLIFPLEARISTASLLSGISVSVCMISKNREKPAIPVENCSTKFVSFLIGAVKLAIKRFAATKSGKVIFSFIIKYPPTARISRLKKLLQSSMFE